jgi:tRNA-specific 2-thiouridylase
MARILSAMSGGVDSSVSTALLVREGHDVVGVSLQLSDESAGGAVSRCCSPTDLKDARLVAGLLGIPYYVINEEAAFERGVRAPFLEEYRAGRTPNPCVRCNSHLKFGSLLRIASSIGATHVATGHYARLREDPRTGRTDLLTGSDRAKDQSYFLFDLSDEQRRVALFPLGEKTKGEVYALAAALDLPVAGKPESQDLCFVPGGDTRAYLRKKIVDGRPGEIVDVAGQVLGRHAGIHDFTVGQRRGLGLASPRPLYVLSLDADADRVVVGPSEELESPGLVASECRLHDDALQGSPFRAEARIRSRHTPSPAIIVPLGGGRLAVRFDTPQRAVTPGQALVLYDDERVLGGGWIERCGLDPDWNSPVACTQSSAERA